MQNDFIPLPNSDIVLREEFDDWAILFNPDTANAVGINPVGVATWKLLDGSRSVKQIIETVHNEFDETPESIDQEILGFIDQLTEYGFIGHELEEFE